MDAKRDSGLYSHSPHNSTWAPSVVSQSHPLFLCNPQQCSHPQQPVEAMPREQMLHPMIRQDHTHSYLYGRDPSSAVPCSLPQLMPSIMTNPRPYNYHHILECGRPKCSRSLPELASQQSSPLPTTTSNDDPWTYKLWSLDRPPTTPHDQQEFSTADVSDGADPGVRFSTNIHSIEITSTGCISEVKSLLSCSFKINLAMSIQENEAQKLVDFLDQALARSCLESKLQQRGLRLLSKICKVHGIVPSSYILRQELVRVGLVHYRSTFAVVSNGEYSGRPVAVKHLKIDNGDTDTTFKRLCREIIIWKHLSHANILPLLGVLISADLRCFRILTEWMPNGNVMQYTKLNPKENRLRLLSEVASGVAYLHELKIVHGDLKGANILVDNTGTARVADFGLMSTVALNTVLFSESLASPGGTLPWMSPELLDPTHFGSKGNPTCESDCYALGMVIYEVLTGLQPFHQMRAFSPMAAVLRGKRPEKPLDAESLGFSDKLWELIRLCWNELSSDRPTALQLLDDLSSASLDWDPPPVYPVRAAGASGVTDSGSSSSSLVFQASSACGARRPGFR